MTSLQEPVNIAAHLPAMARRQPDRQAVVFPHGRDAAGRVSYTHYTFRQLDQESDAIARGLIDYGIIRGTRTVLMVPPSLDFFALTFALFKVGAVPVMVDPGMGVKNLGQCLKEAEPNAFIGSPKAHVARCLFRWAQGKLTRLVTVGPRLFWGGHTLATIRQRVGPNHAFQMATTGQDEVAAILFTSGSTGVPKGVVYTHGIFENQVQKLKTIYGIQPGEIDLPTFPLFALFAPALGMTAIIPNMDATRPASVDPAMIAECIENFGVTNMFGSPALLNRISRFAVARGLRFPSLRRVISAGAPVSSAILERCSKILGLDTQIFTPYGATEALPVASIGSHEILGETVARTREGGGICIGKPVEGIELKVIRITDEAITTWSDDLALPDGEIGEIAVKGANVTREYYNRPESTKLAKIPDPAHGGFYHRMGDVGYRDIRGRIWFCGRKSHRVITPTCTLFTVPCEAIFNTHPEVFRSALVGVQRDGITEPVLCVELDSETRRQTEDQIRNELLATGAKHELTRGIKRILFHPAFPVDIRHNAKIFREKLAVWASQQ
ncbi:MAG: fatty acid CoA ligase family protein [Verrucomicrobia bacterium]|nr:fatty acid CoA ligase family protein [Verrucomicrobiota bacterium]